MGSESTESQSGSTIPLTHTAGPWETDEITEYVNSLLEHAPEWFDEDEAQDAIALKYVRWLEDVNSDLLAQLKNAEEVIRHKKLRTTWEDAVLAWVQAAIAKAEGREP